VIAAAVILDPRRPILGLADSKQLTERRRECLFEQIRTDALAWAIGRAGVDEIDRLNILQASLLAMRRAVETLRPEPRLALIDGNRCPVLPCAARALVGGDRHVPAISAASILAKVTRDREMVLLDRQFPGYGFAGHKGYPTKAHVQALRELGASPIHRRSFGPVRRALDLWPDGARSVEVCSSHRNRMPRR
jgi:ribonuclease HII